MIQRFTIQTTCLLLCARVLAATGAGPERPAADAADARRELLMKNIVDQPFKNDRTMISTVPFILSAYWLNERLPEADAAVIRVASPELPGVGSQKDEQGKNHYVRQSYLLQRVYFLFNSRSEYFPGRMSKTAEDAVASAMWKSASTTCTKEMIRPESMWWNGGSENIIGRTMASLWGAAQILASHPDYRDRKYADGTPVPEMARAFDYYYKQFTRERASKGVMVEVNSGYNEWTLDAWYNIADFSPDPVARKRMRMFLDLYWADYAVEQIDGVRGGSRHRCYPGASSISGAGAGSETAWNVFGLGTPSRTLSPKSIGAATTSYRPSPVVDELVRAGAARGTYEYVTRRLGKGATAEQVGKPKTIIPDSKPTEGEDPEEKQADGKMAKSAKDSGSDEAENVSAHAEALDPNGGNLLRYSYCTPDFVMGTSMLPALPLDAWSAISSQNRWEGVIFAGNRTARIFPQSQANDGRHFYNSSWSVQNKGVMIVQRLRTSKGCKGQRVWFDASLKCKEQSGWVFAEAPQAYAAVRVVDGGSRWEPDQVEIGRPGKGMWLRCENEYSPVIVEVARKSDFAGFTAFENAILANKLHCKNKKNDYHSDFYKTQLTLFADYSMPPVVNDIPLNYNPAKAYDSPFIEGDFGTGLITIRKGARKLELNFNE